MILSFATPGTNRLEFNTIVDNTALVTSGGVICNVGTFNGPNNIIARNEVMGVPMPQVFGPCSYPSSMIQDDISGLAFIEPEAPAPYDYKLAPGSSAVDKAVTSSLIDIDFEGDMRPQGSNKDVGADELMP